MVLLPTTLLCTIGTNLFFPNLSSLDPQIQYQQEPGASDPIGQDEEAAVISRNTIFRRHSRNTLIGYTILTRGSLANSLQFRTPGRNESNATSSIPKKEKLSVNM